MQQSVFDSTCWSVLRFHQIDLRGGRILGCKHPSGTNIWWSWPGLAWNLKRIRWFVRDGRSWCCLSEAHFRQLCLCRFQHGGDRAHVHKRTVNSASLSRTPHVNKLQGGLQLQSSASSSRPDSAAARMEGPPPKGCKNTPFCSVLHHKCS